MQVVKIVSELLPNQAEERIQALQTTGDYHSGTVRFYEVR